MLHSCYHWLHLDVACNLTKDHRIFHSCLKVDAIPLTGYVAEASLVRITVSHLVMSSLNDHPGDGLLSVPNVKIHPFLDMYLEGVIGNIEYADC